MASPVLNATWLWTHALKSGKVPDEDRTQYHQLLPCSFLCPVAEKRQEFQQEVRRESQEGQELAPPSSAASDTSVVGALPPVGIGMSLKGIIEIKTY